MINYKRPCEKKSKCFDMTFQTLDFPTKLTTAVNSFISRNQRNTNCELGNIVNDTVRNINGHTIHLLGNDNLSGQSTLREDFIIIPIIS